MLAALLCAGCSDACRNILASTRQSPDGKRVALLFQRDFGATTGFSTRISILDDSRSLSESGNACVADDDHGVARDADWGGPWAGITWRSPDYLVVRYAANARLFKHAERRSAVSIIYLVASSYGLDGNVRQRDRVR